MIEEQGHGHGGGHGYSGGGHGGGHDEQIVKIVKVSGMYQACSILFVCKKWIFFGKLTTDISMQQFKQNVVQTIIRNILIVNLLL